MLKCSLWEGYTGKLPEMHTHLLVTHSLLILTCSFRLMKVQITALFVLNSVCNLNLLLAYL